MNERNEFIKEKAVKYYNKVSKITGAVNKIKYFINTIEQRELEEIQQFLNGFANTEIDFKTMNESTLFLISFTNQRIKKENQASTKKWAKNNREQSNYLKNRSAARSFIKNKAQKEDLLELKNLIEERLTKLE